MKELFTLLLGAAGALLAIFLKEAVQHALQRRVITWQLFGYLMAWKSNLGREPLMLGIYAQVQERDKALTISLSSGTEAFQAQYLKHKTEGEETRKAIREAVENALKDNEAALLDKMPGELLEDGLAALNQRQNWLIESKTFISDKDASMLGRSVALNVIQFRTAMVDANASFKAIALLAKVKSDNRASEIANMVDKLVQHGEAALIAMARLESSVDRISKRSIPELVWDVLTAK